MASDSLALFASLLVSLSEVLSPLRPRLSLFLLVTSLFLLLAAFRRSYALLALILALSALGCASVLRLVPEGTRERSRLLGKVAPSALAGFGHLAGVWILPFAAVWGWCSARSDREYFNQEIGHLVPATFYYVALVLMPLLLMPRGYQRGGLDHQRYEGAFNLVFSVIYFTIFRTAHHFEGEDMPHLSAPDWDHELLGLVWAGSGASGLLLSRSGIRASVHVAFPALFICYTMLTHSSMHKMDMDQMEVWRLTWMKLHRIHGMCFGIGAACRLLYRLPEAVFFFFLGALDFVFSAQWVVKAVVDALNNKEDTESADGKYPVDHVTALVIVTLGAVLFPLHLAGLEGLRDFLEQRTGVDFEALPTTDDEVCALQEATASINGHDEHAVGSKGPSENVGRGFT